MLICTAALVGCALTCLAILPALRPAPRVIATIRNDSASPNVSDTFVVSTRRVSTTQFVVNILRVDLAAGWSQNPQLDWIAWQ